MSSSTCWFSKWPWGHLVPSFTKLGFNSVGRGDQTEIKSPLCVACGWALLTGFYYSGGWESLMPSFRALSTRRCQHWPPVALQKEKTRRLYICLCAGQPVSKLSAAQAGMLRLPRKSSQLDICMDPPLKILLLITMVVSLISSRLTCQTRSLCCLRTLIYSCMC